MRWKLIGKLIGLSTLVIVELWLCAIVLFGMPFTKYTAVAKAGYIIPTPKITPSVTPPPSLTPPPSDIRAALITSFGIGTVIGALISFAGVIYQTERNIRSGKVPAIELERQKTHYETLLGNEKTQHQNSLNQLQATYQTSLKTLQMGQQSLLDELRNQLQANYQQDLDQLKQQYQLALGEKEQEIQRLKAQDQQYTAAVNAYIETYRNKETTYAKDMTSSYIQPRIDKKTDAGLKLASTLVIEHDPNKLLRMEQRMLKQRNNLAYDVEVILQDLQNDYSRHLVLLGERGIGKTLLLYYLAWRFIDIFPQCLPVYVDLHEFAKSVDWHNFAQSQDRNLLLQYISGSKWNNFPRQEAYKCLDEHLMNGEVLLLLDALDDTTDESYGYIAEIIFGLGSNYLKSPIVVTARKAKYQERVYLAPLRQFTSREILDFHPGQIEHFIAQCLPTSSAGIVDLNAKLERNLRIQTLGANPDLLSQIVPSYLNNLDHPELGIQLYRQCAITWLEKPYRMVQDDTSSIESKGRFLKKAAWYLHDNDHYYFHENELFEIAKIPPVDNPESLQTLLNKIVTENGLLKKGNEYYCFSNLTFQEYFAAQYAIDEQQGDKLLQKTGKAWWEEVIVMYASRAPKAESSSLIHQLTDSPDDIFHTNLLLAGRCFATHQELYQLELVNKIIQHLLEELTKTSFALAREHIINTLIKIGGSNLPSLQEYTRKHIDLVLQDAVIAALEIIEKRPIALHLLASLLNTEISIDTRKRMAAALNERDRKAVIAELLTILTDQVEKSASISLANLLGVLGDRWVAPSLLHLLSSSSTPIDPDVGWYIVNALGTLGEHTDEIIDTLIELLFAPRTDLHIRWSIANALGTLGEYSSSVIAKLQQKLANEQDPDMYWCLINTLRMLGDTPNLYARELPQQKPSSEHIHAHIGADSKLVDLLNPYKKEVVIANLLESIADSSRVATFGTRIYERMLDIVMQYANDVQSVNKLQALLSSEEIHQQTMKDSVYCALWAVSRRVE